uniref:Uncharacterized protein n=1 Tax=Anopheles funestus TaxID=62324 RepID=A0A182RH47_ANOFN
MNSMESVALRTIVRDQETIEEEEPSENTNKTEDHTPKIDVNNFAGLITILTVNFHQLQSLLQVGTDLGFMFWVNIFLVAISITCVYPLLVLRMLHGEGCASARGRYWASCVLMVIVLTTNLTLQIFNDLNAQCVILMNQPLPPKAP